MAVARTALLSLSFDLVQDTGTELEAIGPGMQSNRQPDLLGVSRMHIIINSGQINVEATLGGITTMKNFVVYFPPILVLSLLGLGSLFDSHGTDWSFALFVVPWLVISPFIASAMERRIRQAVERFVSGMSQAKSSI